MKHDEGFFRGAGGLRLYFQSWIPEEPARALLAIVHGFGEHSGRYVNVIHRLVPRGYAVYGMDLRGHGRSPGPRGHITRWGEYREDLRGFLGWIHREAYPGLSCFLLGHSMGGLIAAEYALRQPEGLKGLILSAPLLRQARISPFLFLLSRILSRVWPGFAMETKLDVTKLSRDPRVVKAYQDDPFVHGRGTARLGTEIGTTMTWTHAHAGHLQVPLLILHGGADQLVPKEGSRLFYENVRFSDKTRLEYPGGFHELHNDTISQRVLDDLGEWLEKHLGHHGG